MKGLLLNGYYSFWESAKIMMLSFVAMGILVIATGNPTAQEIFGYMMITALPINAIIASKNDDAAKWNRYELILPVRRDEIVKSKYLTYLMWILLGVSATIVITGLTTIIHNGANISEDISKLYSIFALGIGLAVFGGGLFYPLSYIIGMDKGDSIMVVSFIVSTGVSVFLINMLNIYIPSFVIRMSTFVGIYTVFFGISYILSKNIYKKKEI